MGENIKKSKNVNVYVSRNVSLEKLKSKIEGT